MALSNIFPLSKAFKLIYIMFLTVSLNAAGAKSIESSIESHHSSVNSQRSSIDHEMIKSVVLHRLGFELSDPIIHLNTDEKIMLSFDDLDDQVKTYYYRIQHCNSNWESSELIISEYIDGFQTDQITEYEFSLNTTTPFVHYQLVFPTEYLQLKKSGNYLIQVFEDGNEDDIILERKFKVIDSKLKIEANVKPPLSIKFKKDKQEIGFTISLNNLYIPNPEMLLNVVIAQNHRTDNAISNIKPVRNQGNTLDYNFNNKSIFYGGNEFRAINIKSLKYKTERVNAIEYLRDGYHVYLFEDQLRNTGNYVSDDDLNGNFLIKTEDEINSATEANYCRIHLRLRANSQIMNSDIFIKGKFTEGKTQSETKMKYDAETNTFNASFILKQGYYDYKYFIKDKEGNLSQLMTEGSHYETKNEYSIFVYYREPGTIHDQLIGFEKIIGPPN